MEATVLQSICKHMKDKNVIGNSQHWFTKEKSFLINLVACTMSYFLSISEFSLTLLAHAYRLPATYAWFPMLSDAPFLSTHHSWTPLLSGAIFHRILLSRSLIELLWMSVERSLKESLAKVSAKTGLIQKRQHNNFCWQDSLCYWLNG